MLCGIIVNSYSRYCYYKVRINVIYTKIKRIDFTISQMLLVKYMLRLAYFYYKMKRYILTSIPTSLAHYPQFKIGYLERIIGVGVTTF